MEENKNKISEPFQAPDGYFGSFDARLESRMGPLKKGSGLSVQRGGQFPGISVHRPIGEWVAIAATVAVLAVSTWFFLKTPEDVVPEAQPIARTMPEHIPPVVGSVPENVPVIAAEDELIDVLIEEAAMAQTTSVSEKGLTAKEIAVANELEDAGLIVLETNDGLFDQLEL